MTAGDQLARLAEQLLEDGAINTADLGETIEGQPWAQRMLQFARAVGALHDNAHTEYAAEAPARIGHWTILRLLGTGGMGDVWLGERSDGAVEQRVAIKRVRGASRQLAERLRSERRILARLSHPNIARFVDAGVDEADNPWLALDYIAGVDLGVWCDRERPGLRRRLEVFRGILSAVAHAHRHLIVHRDLKPTNVLVDADGVPHLLDFGIAKLLDRSDGTQTQLACTPAYAAPEQLRGEDVSTATDVYALGLLLFRLLAGVLPETRRDGGIATVLSRLDEEESLRPSRAVPVAPDLPYPAATLAGDLDAIVSHAMRLAPEARYASVAAMLDDIDAYLDSRPVRAREPTRSYRFSRFARRHRWPLAAGVVATLALIVGTGAALWQAQRAGAAAEAQAAEARRADHAAAVATAQAKRAQRASAFVLSVFQQSDLLRRDARGAISIDEAFEDSLRRIDAEFSDDAMLAADLNDDFGEILATKGRFDEAAARFAKALKLAEQAHGVDSPVVAETLINIAAVSSYRGRALDGADAIERAVAILSRHPEADPVQLANARMTLANVRSEQSRGADVLAEMIEALRVYRTHLPPEDQRIGIAVFNLGATLASQGRFAEAAPHLAESRAMAERQQGDDTAALVPILDFQMTNFDNLGQHSEAEEAARLLHTITTKAYPAAHPQRASALTELGYHRLRAGDADAGEALLREGIAMSRELESPGELLGLRFLALGLDAAERWNDALTVAREGGTRCTHYAMSKRCHEFAALALIAQLRRNDTEVTAAQLDALDARIKADNAGGLAPILAQRARAEWLLQQGDHADALTAFNAVHAALAARHPPTHRDVIAAAQRIADVSQSAAAAD
jgi:tetratricopeptide (TPR) repeat protein